MRINDDYEVGLARDSSRLPVVGAGLTERAAHGDAQGRAVRRIATDTARLQHTIDQFAAKKLAGFVSLPNSSVEQSQPWRFGSIAAVSGGGYGALTCTAIQGAGHVFLKRVLGLSLSVAGRDKLVAGACSPALLGAVLGFAYTAFRMRDIAPVQNHDEAYDRGKQLAFFSAFLPHMAALSILHATALAQSEEWNGTFGKGELVMNYIVGAVLIGVAVAAVSHFDESDRRRRQANAAHTTQNVA